ncbi:aspartokinase 2 [Lysinibacillus alkalisoli]|uniref:Aspartokinase n=1 Tax=Lysinibacillus alkalisoli TaxID=1911548 RepID=A0A917G8L5_9BACI|nr:aspartate kinase [Lysinibacillus alkalisoli]GGG28086.1 aspartokinase 2 [Lysinibacillus alkalisoli]
MAVIVVKIGAQTLQSIDSTLQVVDQIKQLHDTHQVVVITAGVHTDFPTQTLQREQALWYAASAQQTSATLAMSLQNAGMPALALTARQAGVYTDASYLAARITDIRPTEVNNALQKGCIVVIGGNQGMTKQEVTYLGEGGAEATAVAMAQQINAQQVMILSTHDGIHTADQSVITEATHLTEISYDELLEFAHLGAHMIHPRAIELAKQFEMPIVMKSLLSQKATIVKGEKEMEKDMIVRGVAFEADIIRLTVGYEQQEQVSLSALFNKLAQHHINVDIIVQARLNEIQPTVSFSIAKEQFAETIKVLEDHKAQLGFAFADFEIGLAKVSIIGSAMASNPGVAARMFDCLAKASIEVKMVSTSEIKVSVVVPQEEMIHAAKTLHGEFELTTEV